MYEQQTGAISLPHNVKSKVGGRVGRKNEREREREMKIQKRGREGERGDIGRGRFLETGREAD